MDHVTRRIEATNELDTVARRMQAHAAGSLDDLTPAQRDERRRQRRNANRRAMAQAMRDLGLRQVRGSRGGTYWE
jgi:hypothetical protein